jgi:hypothetical protein
MSLTANHVKQRPAITNNENRCLTSRDGMGRNCRNVTEWSRLYRNVTEWRRIYINVTEWRRLYRKVLHVAS